MGKEKRKDYFFMALTLIGILLVLAVFFVLLFYVVKTIHFIDIKIYSFLSASGFIAGLMVGTTFLGIAGTLFNTFWKYVFKEHFTLVAVLCRNAIQISILGLIVHLLDQIIDGVEIRNFYSELFVTIVMYVAVHLLARFGAYLKEQESRQKEK
ncbi:hypothetical protein [Paenibacillus oleatilyticus]|uniref:Uncharacterized protein n=1 Tax=Paenibacillus oleatilyticus TaxID=2594886 RepID=A0ABV4V0V4_9BACL